MIEHVWYDEYANQFLISGIGLKDAVFDSLQSDSAARGLVASIEYETDFSDGWLVNQIGTRLRYMGPL